MGGMIALQIAVHHPEMVHKLVLTATSAGGATHVAAGPEMGAMLTTREEGLEAGERGKRNYTRIMAPGYLASHPEVAERVAENARYRPQSAAAYFRQLQAAMTHDVTAKLKDIEIPTLVVHGEVDPLVPTPNGKYLAEHIKGAKLVLYPDTGHIPIVERAADYNRDVLSFLEG